ncbi:hypothetical protein [Staphylococcus shinii]|uniref:hypothetical protein n=1 Tax=Staphylococcus shinii TaxID=2912228 RepID=UPI003EEB804E
MDKKQNKKDSNSKNSDKVIDELPIKLRKYLKSFEYHDMILLKDLIYTNIELNNRRYNSNFAIDLNRDEATIITLLEEIKYNLNQRRTTLYQSREILRDHISSFIDTFRKQNMGEPIVTQIEFDKEEAQKRFAFSEWSNYEARKIETSMIIESMAKPTGNREKDEYNKEIVIHALFALHGNVVPRGLYLHLMSIRQPNFYDIILQLSRVLGEFKTYVGGIHPYILPILKIQPRLIHGLKLYEYIFLYKQLDIEIDEKSNYMIIFNQLEKSYQEGFLVREITFDEHEINKAISEMESLYAF